MSGSAAVKEGSAEDQGAAEANVEAIARQMGWHPKEEFQGDPARWRPAAEFVQRGENILPIVQKQNRELRGQVEQLRGQVTEAVESVKYTTALLRSAEDRSYAKAKRELEAERRAAVESGDTAQFDRAEAQLKELKPPAEPPAQAAKAPRVREDDAPKPEAVSFVERNAAWWDKDQRLTRLAVGIHTDLLESDPDLSLEDNLKRVEAELRERYPERFPRGALPPATKPNGADPDDDDTPVPDNPRRARAASVATPTPGAGGGRRNVGFDALPKESRDQFERQKRLMEGKGKPLTKEEWFKEAAPLYGMET